MNNSDISKTAEVAGRAAGLAASSLAAQAQAGLLPAHMVPAIVEQLDGLADMLENAGADGGEYRAIARFVEAAG